MLYSIKQKDSSARVGVVVLYGNGGYKDGRLAKIEEIIPMSSVDAAMANVGKIAGNQYIYANYSNGSIKTALQVADKWFNLNEYNSRNKNLIYYGAVPNGYDHEEDKKKEADTYRNKYANNNIKFNIIKHSGYTEKLQENILWANIYESKGNTDSTINLTKGIVYGTKIGPGNLKIELNKDIVKFDGLESKATSAIHSVVDGKDVIEIKDLTSRPKDNSNHQHFTYYVRTNPNAKLDVLQNITREAKVQFYNDYSEVRDIPSPELAMPSVTANVLREFENIVPNALKNASTIVKVQPKVTPMGVEESKTKDSKQLASNEKALLFKPLPKFDENGKDITYEIREEGLNEHLVTLFNPSEFKRADTDIRMKTIVKNLIINVTKTWINDNGKKDITIRVKGFVDNEEINLSDYGKNSQNITRVIDKKTGTISVQGLPRITKDGRYITYSVMEEKNGDFNPNHYLIKYNYSDRGMYDENTKSVIERTGISNEGYMIIDVPNRKIGVNKIKIIKTDINGNTINGARVGIKKVDTTDANNIYNGQVATLSQGSYEFKNANDVGFTDGIYYITEIQAPGSYIKIPRNIKLEIKTDGEIKVDNTVLTDTEIVTDNYKIRKVNNSIEIKLINKKNFTLHIKKRNKASVNAVTQTEVNSDRYDIGKITGANFKLEKKDGSSWNTIFESQAVNADGYLSRESLVQGTYRLSEVQVPDGYKGISAPIEFTVDDSAPIDTDNSRIFYNNNNKEHLVVVVKNAPKPKDIKIVKVDKDGSKLQGARFEIWNTDSNEQAITKAFVVGNNTTDANGETGIFNNGATKFNEGLYILKEVQAPIGYKSINEDIKIYVSHKKEVIIPAKKDDTGKWVRDTASKLNSKISVAIDDTYNWKEDKTLNVITISNERAIFTLKLKKREKSAVDAVEVTNKDENAYNDGSLKGATFKIERQNGNTWTTISEREATDNQGNFTKENLEHGTYRLTELTAPDGYIRNTQPITFNTTSTVVTNNDNIRIFNTTSGEVVTIFKNKSKPKDIQILKVDEDNPNKKLSGANFEIWKGNEDGQLVSKTGVSGSSVTNGSGVAGIYNNGGPGYEDGLYYIKEVQAPNNYKALSKPIPFYVTRDKEVIIPAKKEASGTWVKDTNSEFDSKISVSINDGYVYKDTKSLNIITIKNRHKRLDIKVIKTDKDGNIIEAAKLGGTRFGILDSNKAEIGGQVKNINNIIPKANSDEGLEDIFDFNANKDGYSAGLYYLREKKAPTGYAKLINDIPMYIDEDYNVYAPVKLDADGHVMMQGATPVIDNDTYEFRDETVKIEPFNDYHLNENKNLVKIIVKNKLEVQYPATGGIGTVIFYVVGFMLMLYTLFIKKRIDD